jgi:hypothetical protein
MCMCKDYSLVLQPSFFFMNDFFLFFFNYFDVIILKIKF